MPRRPENRPERDIVTDQLEPQAPARGKATPAAGTGSGRSATASGSRKPRATKATKATPPPVTGVVGDASAAVTRSGEDVRRRGWFWHWNNIVTQYAPLIGLKGVGLINSYTVWTDRRESSPHRGYAFPSQQSEADFYGEDRAELITINKILVALDLIEIRKEMVPRTDEKGRRWKVPHNLYRVKDHDDDFQLTTEDVMKVVELANRDRAVYRYVRRMFSPKFSPIDSQNVWHSILEEVRQDPTWQKLAEKTAKDEWKASARSKAGHASRRTNDPTTAFSLPNDGDKPEPKATGSDSNNDSTTVEKQQRKSTAQTSVAKTNKGLATSDERSNNGFVENGAPSVAPTNTDGPTSVQPTNTMYYQSLTTTTTEESGGAVRSQLAFDSTNAPDQARTESEAIRFFEEANNRVSTPAERRLLRQLAELYDPAAREQGGSGWLWVGMAIDDAVGAGSAFVAPKRIREILARWQREGLPEEHLIDVADRAGPAQAPVMPVTTSAEVGHRQPVMAPEPQPGEIGAEPFVSPVFMIEDCGLTNRQVWTAVMGDLHQSGAISQADVSTWLRDAAILDCVSGEVVIGVPHELARRRAAGRYAGSIRQSLERVTGLRVDVSIILFRDWDAA